MGSSRQKNRVKFRVEGVPVAKGSMRGFVVNNKAILTSSAKGLKPWQKKVSEAAREVFSGEPWKGAVSVEMKFFLPRPKAHFGTGKNADELKGSAPDEHINRPDIDKLSRAVLDGMTGVVYSDDAQVTCMASVKEYAEGFCGVVVSAFQQ